jgi:hypothetical protein
MPSGLIALIVAILFLPEEIAVSISSTLAIC